MDPAAPMVLSISLIQEFDWIFSIPEKLRYTMTFAFCHRYTVTVFIKVLSTVIKFMSLEFLGLSHRIPGKIRNAIYSLEICTLVSEILKFEKCVEYANEKTDDIIHLTQ